MADAKHPALMNARHKNRMHPNTFDIPPAEDIARLRPGHFVKVGALTLDDNCRYESEKFWAIVTKVEGQHIEAEINNDLVLTEFHELSDKDLIALEPKHILNILWGDV